MPKKRSAERTRDRVSIYDVWAAKGRREGKRWVYRVWDRQVRKYRRQAFADQPTEDAHRRKPGCAAGDAWATKQLAKFHLGQDSATVVTLRMAGESFLGVREALGRSASQLAIIRFVLEAACDAGVDDLSDRALPDVVQRWLGSLKASPRGKTPQSEAGLAAAKARKAKQPPATPRTKNKYLTVLRSIGNHAVRRRMMTYNPFDAVERFAEPRRFRHGYTIDKLRRLVSDDRRDDNWWLFVVLAAYTGLRSETIRSLTWNMVDWQANRIRVPADITKTNSDVRVPIQPELRTILAENPGIGLTPILSADIAKMTSDQANVETQAYLRRYSVPFGIEQRTAIPDPVQPPLGGFGRTGRRMTERAGEGEHPPAQHGQLPAVYRWTATLGTARAYTYDWSSMTSSVNARTTLVTDSSRPGPPRPPRAESMNWSG